MPTEFLDIATKAKKLGISEGVLRARILSGKENCFVYLSNARAFADSGEWLPPWSEDSFPIVEWMDHGSLISHETFSNWRFQPYRIPSYHVSGWVGLDRFGVEAVLTRGECELDGPAVYVCNSDMNPVCRLRVQSEPKKEWVTAEYEEGGYWRDVPILLTEADLFIPAQITDAAPRMLSPRKEQSYLGIIAAMRTLLRSTDGGGFPSDAKIIELLVSRYGSNDGVSKRNLEGVFAAATRAANDVPSQ